MNKMSTTDNKSNNTSSVLTRDEFLSKFKSENNKQKSTPQGIIRRRWAFLYDLNKLRQAKFAERRMDKQAESDYLFTHQCTFLPKTNKLPKYLVKKDEKTSSKLKNSERNMFKRQEEWIHRLKIKNETLKQENNNQLTTHCHFHPVTQNTAEVEQLNLKDKVESVIRNYNSYKSYIERVNSQRKDKVIQSERMANRPGSGRGWKRGMLATTNHYDYSQHEYLAQRLSPQKMCLYKNTKNDKVRKADQKMNSPSTHSKKINRTYENNILFTEQTIFRNALNQLHNELLSINLMNDE